MAYEELSRRGLIKLNRDYDVESNNALKEFLNNSQTVYEPIRPIEQVIDKIDKTTEAMEARGSAVSDAIMDRVNHVFDTIIGDLTSEANRCSEVIDESADDEQYPDDDDNSEDDDNEE